MRDQQGYHHHHHEATAGRQPSLHSSPFARPPSTPTISRPAHSFPYLPLPQPCPNSTPPYTTQPFTMASGLQKMKLGRKYPQVSQQDMDAIIGGFALVLGASFPLYLIVSSLFFARDTSRTYALEGHKEGTPSKGVRGRAACVRKIAGKARRGMRGPRGERHPARDGLGRVRRVLDGDISRQDFRWHIRLQCRSLLVHVVVRRGVLSYTVVKLDKRTRTTGPCGPKHVACWTLRPVDGACCTLLWPHPYDKFS